MALLLGKFKKNNTKSGIITSFSNGLMKTNDERNSAFYRKNAALGGSQILILGPAPLEAGSAS